MEDKFKDLKSRLIEIDNLQRAGAVLGWDQATHMPPGGADARSRQLSTLGRLAQEKFIDPEIGQLLDDLEPYAESLPYESDKASLIRVARRDYDQATKVPPELIGEMYAHGADSFQAWAKARPANDFTSVIPNLEKMLDLSRQLANCFPGYEHIADPLIDFQDYGMKVSIIRPLFAKLREQLVPLVQAITSQSPIDDSCLREDYPEAEQLAFSEIVVKDLGYDYQRGRVDKTHHPFEVSFSIGDVRITTRIQENWLGECLFSMMHEAGHAMYEQGINANLEGTPLADGTSSGVHESQSRLWENVVGRSKGFWEYYFPKLQDTFPNQLGDTDLETFYRAINKVERSLIRTDADEITYNLHVMIRFDLELALLEGSLEVKDLPQVWNKRYQTDLGITPPDDSDGVLQDMHWFYGRIGGMFQGYTLGNILSAQFYQEALKSHPGIPDDIKVGNFGPLHDWLRENIYQHGSKFTPNELVQKVTGGPITIEPYIQYLTSKYGAIYQL